MNYSQIVPWFLVGVLVLFSVFCLLKMFQVYYSLPESERSRPTDEFQKEQHALTYWAIDSLLSGIVAILLHAMFL